MPLTITDATLVVFDICALDIVGPMPETEGKTRYMLTCQNALSKFTVATPIPSHDAETVTKTFVKEVVIRNITKKRKKGIRDPDSFRRNIIKKARVAGKEYIGHGGKKQLARDIQ
ncbi:hypothetical protein PR048_028415 [Dryococelus australis]|uniref:60S ribosomal protein L14 n=1 Tax=Dryococelus australis TaxID=614101 RepID=A0ABQ9GAG9_9NEOP|nr:hypothetical protein PR048_028415 [Dryococelus australis]